MARKIKLITVVSLLVTAVSAIIYRCTDNTFAFAMTITFGTISYHFLMRIFIGSVVNLLFHNQVNYEARWFRVSDKEQKVYQILKVKQWKGKMGTYDPSCFDRRIHSWDEIAQATGQAEIVHELIILFSFLPVFAAIPYGEWLVFIITSIGAACLDGMFVIMQRYNRSRIIKVIEKSKGGK